MKLTLQEWLELGLDQIPLRNETRLTVKLDDLGDIVSFEFAKLFQLCGAKARKPDPPVLWDQIQAARPLSSPFHSLLPQTQTR
jgi:hypothetical protein